MRIFISSTVYDLIDVRGEIAELLRSLDIAPVLSDDKLSDFRVQSSVNSIETCLVNVAACDECVVILDKRYGPRLGEHGFDDVSATHLEYRHATKNERPVHVFVRDRLEADYAIWKRNKRKDSVDLTWIEKKDYGLFDLLNEHTKLSAKAPKNNWYMTYTSSIDLKAAIRNHFERRILPSRLVDAIHSSTFPLFDVTVDVDRQAAPFLHLYNVVCRPKNVGGAPAFNVAFRWEQTDSLNPETYDRHPHAIVPASGDTSLMLVIGEAIMIEGFRNRLHINYESQLGVAVHDIFEVGGQLFTGMTVVSGAQLKDRTFKRAPAVTLVIDESDLK